VRCGEEQTAEDMGVKHKDKVKYVPVLNERHAMKTYWGVEA